MPHGLPYSHGRRKKVLDDIVKDSFAVEPVITVSATGTGVGFGSASINELPKGNILLLGAVANLTFQGSGADANLVDTWNGDFGIGTTPADDATITGTDVDIVPSTAVGPAVSEVSPQTTGRSTQTENGVIIDNTDGLAEVNLNLLIDAADITDDTSVDITVSGDVHLSYVVLGN